VGCGHFHLCSHSDNWFSWPDSVWVLNRFKDCELDSKCVILVQMVYV